MNTPTTENKIEEFVNANYSFFTEDTRNKMILGIKDYLTNASKKLSNRYFFVSYSYQSHNGWNFGYLFFHHDKYPSIELIDSKVGGAIIVNSIQELSEQDFFDLIGKN